MAGSDKHVVVVGAGVGGLAAAIDVARHGIDVTVLERADAPGGKMREVAVGGATVDAGPTVLTMPSVFEDLFDAAGASLASHVRLTALDRLARHAWSADERLDLFADRKRSADAIGRLAGPREARGYLDFCKRAREIFETLDRSFIRAPKPTPAMLALRVLRQDPRGLGRISPFANMWRELGRYFRDPRLRQLFGRYATYCGSSPFSAPATLMLVAHVEQEGVWVVDGGMHRLARALEAVAAGLGVRFRYGSPVGSVSVARGSVTGITLGSGEWLAADAVIVNADASAIAAKLFGEAIAPATPEVPHSARSLSALTFAAEAECRDFPLLRHNVFLSRDYAAEFADLVDRRVLPRRPSVYVCCQSRDAFGNTDVAARETGRDRLLCVVNAPATGDEDRPDKDEVRRCEDRSFELLARCGLRIDRATAAMVRTTPQTFSNLFPGTGGALYGRASHGWRASFRRPGARTRIPGLYLAGGDKHPGPGVPMAALSGRQAAASLVSDLASTRGWRPMGTPGGMLTQSATTEGTGSR